MATEKTYTIDEAYNLASECANRKETDKAIFMLRRILEVRKDHVASLNALAGLLPKSNLDEAIGLYRQALHYAPKASVIYGNLGVALMNKGNMEEAQSMFREAVAINPLFLKSWHNLSFFKYSSVNHRDIRKMQKLIATHGDKLENIEWLYFALGKAHDDNKLYDKAFAYYRKANAIRNKKLSFDPLSISNAVDNYIRVFNKDFFASSSITPSPNKSPIFIVGMPRSGTTLLAGMLSNHPAMHNAGELSTMLEQAVNLHKTLGIETPYPQAIYSLTDAVAQQIIAAYETKLRQDAPSDVPYVIDKHPINYFHLGLIQTLFPNAKIIHCTRNPLDTCLSNYFQCFNNEYSYSFDLLNVGHFYKGYRKLMAHWKEVLTIDMLEVSYDDIISDTEQTMRTLLDFLGVDWNESCLSAHTSRDTVSTASIWQVRQPIYRKSLARWQHYEKHLAPLKELLTADNL